jgi:hypothetical protein
MLMTSALVIDSHYLEHNIKYDVVEQKRVLFRFVGTAFVGVFRFSAVLVEVYMKMRFGTSRNAVRSCYPIQTNIFLQRKKVVMVMLNFQIFLPNGCLVGYFFVQLLENKFNRNSPIHREVNT